MKRKLPLAALLAWHASVLAAAGALPPHLTGFWCTADSLYAGTAAQSEIILDTDGFGVMAGSSAVVRLTGTPDDGKPAPRAIIGFQVRATLAGDTLAVHPFMPPTTTDAAPVAMPGMVIACRYDAAGPTLTCTGPDGIAQVMHRIGATVPDEVAPMIAAIRKQAGD